ncbi:MAG: ribose-phosphate diphosphokinase [Acidimicrobiia bacterium]|nr:ribose-phosphate diphosphokinase [Acidimicrobiia bacterium]MYC57873.1 ribose-phosphate diphosphokinase [Acidimicrobiia bacterium]MYG93420.1 ribose-phosphate diphosphokinase [Acidimicrobiia bacterium]MYI31176.1 ribose-phosphate diphosphokinase [Acidimicrobiia bacterium]
MEVVTKKKLVLISGRANQALAAEIAEVLDEHLVEPNLADFANGEIHCRFGESVRGTDVFIVQSHTAYGEATINDAMMEHLIMVDAARRASAKRITAVCPFFGYARQDRKAVGREPITAKLMANAFLASGADRMLSVDLHSGQMQGFFDGPWDHLTAMPVLAEYLKGIAGDLAVVSPDAGRVKVAERYSNELGADLAIVHKRRAKDVMHSVEATEVVGDVVGRTCVLIDDMIDTGGTIVAAAGALAACGAANIVAATTHGVFSGPAIDRIKNSQISKVVITNTLPLPPEKQIDKIEVLSVASVIADAIDAVFEDTSVSEIFGGKNLS